MKNRPTQIKQRGALDDSIAAYSNAVEDSEAKRASLRVFATSVDVQWLLSEMTELMHALRGVVDEGGKPGSDEAVCKAVSECVDVAYTVKRVASSLCSGGDAIFEAIAALKKAGREELEDMSQLDGIGEDEYQRKLSGLKSIEADNCLGIFSMMRATHRHLRDE